MEPKKRGLSTPAMSAVADIADEIYKQLNVCDPDNFPPNPAAIEIIERRLWRLLRQVDYPISTVPEDIVRVRRLIEYVGARSVVEKQVANSLHGTKSWTGGCSITAVDLAPFPEIITPAEEMEARIRQEVSRIATIREPEPAK